MLTCRSRLLKRSRNRLLLLRRARYIWCTFIILVMVSVIFYLCVTRIYLVPQLDINKLCAFNLQNFSSLTDVNYKEPARYSIVSIIISPSAYPHPFLESKSIYADLHNYQLQIYYHQLDYSRNIFWNKVLTVARITKQLNSSITWIWLLDYDTLIFNFAISLEDIIEKEAAESTDILYTTDSNGLNGGSILIRNSRWIQEFLLPRWYNTNNESIPRIGKWCEQGSLDHLINTDPEIKRHAVNIDIRKMNSYGGRVDGTSARFREGDFLVHFPGNGFKYWMNGYARIWSEMMGKEGCDLRNRWFGW
ncbi:unnamed protein product [Didymodactylos carnosus]|uniref:Uncharacterized protein n=1 Tax=Didymodactylos carnosus TaxID=1234261 RepID=A0A815D9C5_9BILA|nr:unnamed protein product [Didymodactylos carnosus]CAF4117666.1 unnamed protein product [Didymodactylos carnosus]